MAVFVLSRCFLDFIVGVGSFVIRLSQISSFFLFSLSPPIYLVFGPHYYKEDYLNIFLIVYPFDCIAVEISGMVWSVNHLTTQVEWLLFCRPDSVSNRRVIYNFGDILCFHFFFFLIFGWYW